MLDFRIETFLCVCRSMNYTRAAEELHLAQPSVSLAIKELEEYYGIRLFERIGRGISPTEGAKEFYGYALHIVSLFDEMETKIKNWDTLGTLRLGTSIAIGTHILPILLEHGCADSGYVVGFDEVDDIANGVQPFLNCLLYTSRCV